MKGTRKKRCNNWKSWESDLIQMKMGFGERREMRNKT